MNFETFKIGFLSYLEEKLGNTDSKLKEQIENNSDISIFMFSNEFKDYVSEELGADISIFSKGMSEIIDMDFENGQFVNNQSSDDFTKNEDINNFTVDILNDALSNDEVKKSIDKDQNGEVSQDEAQAFIESLSDENGVLAFDKLAQETANIISEGDEEISDTQDDASEMTGTDALLDKIYNNKSIIKALDKDGDGILSDEEKAEFEDYAKSLGKNPDELTEKDIKKAVSNILDGTYKNDKELKDKTDEDENADTDNKNSAAKGTSSGGGGGGGVSGIGGGGGGGSVAPLSSTPSGVQNEEKTFDSMSLEELESEKTSKESEVTKAQDEVNAVYSGENEAVKNAEEDCDSAKEAYDKAVEEDENISDELKEEREENLSAIDEEENVISGLESDINNKEGEISNQESVIASDESNIAALESALSALNGESSDDPDVQAEIESKKAAAEAALNEAKEQLSQDEKTLDDLNQELEDLQTQLEEEEGNLEELESEKSRIEEEISKNCSKETEDAMKAYNEAKENIETVKASELETAKANLDTAKAELDDINTKINEKKAKATQRDYGMNTSGSELLDRLEDAGGDAFNGFDNLCATLGMDREETAEYIAYLCESEEWGNGCIDPVIFCAQLRQESGFNGGTVGDGGYAVGLGQLHEIAVGEVNRYWGTSYSGEDRWDPQKNLEITMLFLKECYQQTGDTEGMLGMYNQGTLDKARSADGQAYVRQVLSRLNNVPQYT